jgi:hypothetical protein
MVSVIAPYCLLHKQTQKGSYSTIRASTEVNLMKRTLNALFILLLVCQMAFPQQLQTLDDTDSLKQRRIKTNENFHNLLDRISSNSTAIAGKENQLTVTDTLSQIGDTVSCEACVDTFSTQSLSGKTLVTSIIQGYNRASLPTGATTGSIAPVSDDVRGLWMKSASQRFPLNGERVNVKEFGAKGDARHSNNAGMTSGSPKLSCSDCNFTSADVGKTVSVKGAGASGAPLITTITSISSSTTAILKANASVTISSKRVIIGSLETTAIGNAKTAATGRTLYFPTGSYLIRATATGGGALAISSNTVVIGDGAIIYLIGSDGQDIGDTDDKAGLFVDDGKKNIVIQGLRFIGENYPFTYVENNATNCIAIKNAWNVTVRDCQFEDLFGFAIHNWGTALPGGRINAQHNLLIDCANGLNVNSDYSDQSYNVFYNSEGIEASGGHSNYSHNLIIDGLTGGISLGGRTATNDFGPGSTCSHNIITGMTKGGGIGISLNDGFINGGVSHNIIYKTAGPGIQVVGGGFNAVSGNRIQNNTIISAGATGNPNPYGILIGSDADSTLIENNDVRDGGYSGFQTTYGLVLTGSTDAVIVRGNRFGGHNNAVIIGDSTNSRFSGNTYTEGTIEITTSPTFAEMGDFFESNPAQWTTNKDNYDAGVNRVLRLSTDASRNLSGIAGGWKGRLLTIINVGSNALVIKNQDSSSSAANRLITGTGKDLTISADGRATLFYDSTTSRWRVL